MRPMPECVTVFECKFQLHQHFASQSSIYHSQVNKSSCSSSRTHLNFRKRENVLIYRLQLPRRVKKITQRLNNLNCTACQFILFYRAFPFKYCFICSFFFRLLYCFKSFNLTTKCIRFIYSSHHPGIFVHHSSSPRPREQRIRSH